MIPKKIHQCWFGPAPVPAKHRVWMEGIRSVMPDFAYRLWTNDDLPGNRFVRECLAWKKYALLSDWMRLEILDREGGFYLDTDVEVFKSLAPLLEEGCVVGLEKESLEKKPVSNAIIGAEPGHPYVRETLERFVRGLNRHLKPPYGVKVGNWVLFDRGLARCCAQRLDGIRILSRDELFRDFTCHHLEGSWHSRNDLRAKLRSIGYRSTRAWILARGLAAGRPPYPGSPPWKGP
jgi:hypothetical protein